MTSKVFVGGCARSVASYLGILLPQIDVLRKGFNVNSLVCIVEDSSTDDTKTVLKNWQNDQSTKNHEIKLVLDFDNKDSVRAKRIAKARNKVITVFKENGLSRPDTIDYA